MTLGSNLYRVCYANPKERANAIKLSKFLNYLHEDLGGDTNYPLPLMIEKALGKTSVTSVVADTAERAPKGSYKRNYATGFDGWLEEIETRNGSLPHKDIIDKLKMIVDVWKGPKFNAVDWVQGEPTLMALILDMPEVQYYISVVKSLYSLRRQPIKT